MSGLILRMKRTERLFAIAEHLRGRRTGITAEALAQRFGVTVRTMYRDLDTLRFAQMPISAERGRGGGFALDAGYSLPPVNFSAREAALLLALGRFAIDQRLLPFAGTLEGGLEKVRSALSHSAQRELLRRLPELIFLGVPALPVAEPVRAAIERAWFENANVTIIYVDAGNRETTRTVRIQSVVMDRHETRLRVLQTTDGELREFRLDRILSAAVQAPAAPRAPSPNAAAGTRRSLARAR
jgi:predicted DNA-binding transcriptional regulator YafY